jgi:hypothetical protein
MLLPRPREIFFGCLSSNLIAFLRAAIAAGTLTAVAIITIARIVADCIALLGSVLNGSYLYLLNFLAALPISL